MLTATQLSASALAEFAATSKRQNAEIIRLLGVIQAGVPDASVPAPPVVAESAGSASASSAAEPSTLALVAPRTTRSGSVATPEVLSSSALVTKKTVFKGKKARVVTPSEQQRDHDLTLAAKLAKKHKIPVVHKKYKGHSADEVPDEIFGRWVESCQLAWNKAHNGIAECSLWCQYTIGHSQAFESALAAALSKEDCASLYALNNARLAPVEDDE